MLRTMLRSHVQASTDGLSGLLNRRTLETRLRRLHRSGTPFSFVMADLDHFKRLNDTHGHEAGDRALRLFAEVASSTVRSNDLTSRWGGEEFAFVFVNASPEEAADAIDRSRVEPRADFPVVRSPGSLPVLASPTPVSAPESKRSSERPTLRCIWPKRRAAIATCWRRERLTLCRQLAPRRGRAFILIPRTSWRCSIVTTTRGRLISPAGGREPRQNQIGWRRTEGCSVGTVVNSFRVGAGVCHQFLMAAHLDNAGAGQHDDEVGHAHCREAMGDEER